MSWLLSQCLPVLTEWGGMGAISNYTQEAPEDVSIQHHLKILKSLFHLHICFYKVCNFCHWFTCLVDINLFSQKYSLYCVQSKLWRTIKDLFQDRQYNWEKLFPIYNIFSLSLFLSFSTYSFIHSFIRFFNPQPRICLLILEREGERERNIDQLSPANAVTGVWIHNPDVSWQEIGCTILVYGTTLQ